MYGGDEVDFFWRLQLAGYRFTHVPAAVVNYQLQPLTRHSMRRGFAKGRAAALLYARFAEHGAEFRATIALQRWARLLLSSYRLVGGADLRHEWLTRAAENLGRLRGGIEQRRLFF